MAAACVGQSTDIGLGKATTHEIAFSALVVGGTDTSRRTGPQLVLLPVPHFRELGPESLKWWWLVSSGSLIVVLPVEVCPGVGTCLVVALVWLWSLWWYLVVVGVVVELCSVEVMCQLTSALGRRQPMRSRSGRDGGARRDPNRWTFLRSFGRIELPQALLDQEELLRSSLGVVCGTLSDLVKLFLTLAPWSVSSVLDTLTPVFELYVRLRERRQRTSTCVEVVLRLVACSALVVGGTDTSRRTRPQLVLLPLPHFRKLGPESLKVPGMGLQSSSPFPCGGVDTFRLVLCQWSWLVISGSLIVVLPVEVCPGVGTILVVVGFARGGVPCGGTGLVVVFVVVPRGGSVTIPIVIAQELDPVAPVVPKRVWCPVTCDWPMEDRGKAPLVAPEKSTGTTIPTVDEGVNVLVGSGGTERSIVPTILCSDCPDDTLVHNLLGTSFDRDDTGFNLGASFWQDVWIVSAPLRHFLPDHVRINGFGALLPMVSFPLNMLDNFCKVSLCLAGLTCGAPTFRSNGQFLPGVWLVAAFLPMMSYPAVVFLFVPGVPIAKNHKLKLNVDGAFKLDLGIVAAGGILRTGYGDIIFAFAARYYDIHSSLEAEALALKDGIPLCCERGVKEFNIESDSLVLVETMKGKYSCPWRLSLLAFLVSLSLVLLLPPLLGLALHAEYPATVWDNL
ncbi:hypothetical protein Taro_041779 [Colocasia esculenta]|uniref:RNase H type-1 domain-containing protein n=1 Tax=Colocasia esculenta TaxID=4460 RepID=A0A843WUK6_COLES|nr:hypothetical protein [Colocasia esculenta]